MTERLYYTDPYATEFDANLLSIDHHDGRPAAILDRTAFYPTSGGQPFDTGVLGTARIVEVVDRDDGAILHVMEAEGGVAPGPIRGRIDWARRFEHMQQHTGQHVLSAAFDRLLAARTESFHLGSISSTIDLGRPVSAAEIARVEEEANRIVWEDRPVAIRFADAAEAAKLPLRKEPARGGLLRLIDVEDFDISACGGTHVARTGAIGIIAVASSERFRGGTRVEFLCGGRALNGYRALRDAVASSVRLISVLPAELPAAIERMQGEGKDARRQVKDLQTRLATFEAAALAERAVVVRLKSDPASAPEVRLVVEVLDGLDAGGLKTMASSIVERAGHAAVLFSATSPRAVVAARAPGVALDSGVILQKLIERFGGKGGGRPELAQGGGLQGEPADLIAFTRALIAGAA